MRKVIYYFTGTGNSMRAAEKIAAHLKDTEIISMRSNPKEVPADDAEVIGFIYPIYHWTLPEPAVNFVEKLTINPNAYIFTVAMPSFIVGYACEKLEELLKQKGAKIAYGTKVYGVANYVTLYPPFPSPKRVVPRTEKELSRIAEDIAARKTKAIPRANTLTQKRFPKMMPKYQSFCPAADYGFIINDSCISCGLCSRACPCHNIDMVDGKPSFKHQCSQCMACISYCPKRAIGYKLPDFLSEQCKGNFLSDILVKSMSLPQKRKTYHHPYVSAADITENVRHID